MIRGFWSAFACFLNAIGWETYTQIPNQQQRYGRKCNQDAAAKPQRYLFLNVNNLDIVGLRRVHETTLMNHTEADVFVGTNRYRYEIT